MLAEAAGVSKVIIACGLSTGKIYRGSTCQLKHDLLNFPLLHEEVPADRKAGYPYGYCLRYKCGLESGL